jgi:hypothetical protein
MHGAVLPADMLLAVQQAAAAHAVWLLCMHMVVAIQLMPAPEVWGLSGVWATCATATAVLSPSV